MKKVLTILMIIGLLFFVNAKTDEIEIKKVAVPYYRPNEINADRIASIDWGEKKYQAVINLVDDYNILIDVINMYNKSLVKMEGKVGYFELVDITDEFNKKEYDKVLKKIKDLKKRLDEEN